MVAKQSKPQWDFEAANGLAAGKMEGPRPDKFAWVWAGILENWRESKIMSTTAMWLLLAVVVIVILFASVLYKRTFTTKELAMTGVMAALSLVAYLFFRVPFYGGSSFHLGNTFTALTALLLDGVSGGLAGITCGAVAHKAFKLRDLDKHSSGYLVKVIVSAGSGLLLNVLTDPFLGYFRNVYIFGQEYTVAQALTKIAGGVTFVNSVASTVCAVILYLALRPALERAGLLPKGEKH